MKQQIQFVEFLRRWYDHIPRHEQPSFKHQLQLVAEENESQSRSAGKVEGAKELAKKAWFIRQEMGEDGYDPSELDGMWEEAIQKALTDYQEGLK